MIVPPCEHMPLATLQQLLSLAECGGRVAFQKLPRDVPGWGDLAARRQALQKLLGTIPLLPMTEGQGQETRRGTGSVLVGSLDDVLALCAVAREPLVDQPGLF